MAEDRLERLRELPLRGFDEIDDDTPSSGTASLPTPQLDAEELHTNQVTLINTTPLAPQEPEVGVLRAPGAPLLKDYDSFTEGSRAGSFDFLSSASGDLCYPINTSTAEMMGEPSNSVGFTVNDLTHLGDDDTCVSIEEWRVNVALDTPNAQIGTSIPSSTTAKRPRSPTPEVVRRIRPRARSLSSASSATNGFDWFAPLPEGIERPPSRATSAPD